MYLINISDIPNEDGITPREKNRKKTHNIPLKSLVETEDGLRLWVVAHERDCDETPLYALSHNKEWEPDMYGPQFRAAARFALDAGYPEETLKIIKKV